MYCPQCGTDSASNVQYCRSCGANLKVIGKAVALSEAIARSDRGPMPKIREMVKNLKVDQVTDEVSKALERMNHEIAQTPPKEKDSSRRPFVSFGSKKTAEERREARISKGIVSMFSGVGLTIFLYYLSAALVLRLPVDVIMQIPFEIQPVVRMIWLVGLIPTLSGFGHIVSGLMIRPQRTEAPQLESRSEPVSFPSKPVSATPSFESVPRSVTENTTNLLDGKSVQ